MSLSSSESGLGTAPIALTMIGLDLENCVTAILVFGSAEVKCQEHVLTRQKFSPEGLRWIRPKASATGSLNILVGLTLKECTVSFV